MGSRKSIYGERQQERSLAGDVRIMPDCIVCDLMNFCKEYKDEWSIEESILKSFVVGAWLAVDDKEKAMCIKHEIMKQHLARVLIKCFKEFQENA